MLPAFVAFNGLTDAWGDLLKALRNLRAFAHDELTGAELETVDLLIGEASRVGYHDPA